MSEEESRLVIAHENAHLARKDHIFKPLGFLFLAVYWFSPLVWVAYILFCRDVEKACEEYSDFIATHPIDVQILGIGGNGHIAFNEPTDTFPPTTHIVDLTESTIEANKRFFASADSDPRTCSNARWCAFPPDHDCV